MHSRIPPAVNFHLWKPCNFACHFCFATFDDDPALQATRGGIGETDACRILESLRAEGCEKLTFVGGEPTLCPHLPRLLQHARRLGFVTSLVTNGTHLRLVLDRAPQCLDWVGLSVDSAIEEVQTRLGRGKGDHVARSLEHAGLLHSLDIRVKLNSVITRLNHAEDMSTFVGHMRPERWKIFQVLPVAGQNDGKVTPLLISAVEFQRFVDRHQHLQSAGVTLAPETNDDMTGSYAMIDPLGRFFSNVGGRHHYSRPILEVGARAAFGDIAYDAERFARRGGLYDWGVPLQLSARRGNPQ